jgi:pyrimidine operon attenuation protein/uracil phosphoribosyltransferase
VTITIEPTTAIVSLDGVEARIWEGVTDAGVPVVLAVAYVGCDADASIPDLVEVKRPTLRSLAMFADGPELELGLGPPAVSKGRT